MKHRTYRLVLQHQDDVQAFAFLRERVPKTVGSLVEARAIARAVRVLFPKVEVEIVSVTRPMPAQATAVQAL